MLRALPVLVNERLAVGHNTRRNFDAVAAVTLARALPESSWWRFLFLAPGNPNRSLPKGAPWPIFPPRPGSLRCM